MRNGKIAVLALTLPTAVIVAAGQSLLAAPPPTTQPGAPAYVQVVDDTGSISVDVPITWNDIDTSPDTQYDPAVPAIRASTDYQQFLDSYDVSAVFFIAEVYRTDLETIIEFYDTPFDRDCAGRTTEPYDSGNWVGIHVIYSQCGPSRQAEFHVVVANPTNQAFTAIVQIQISGPQDLPYLDRIIGSFDMTEPVTASATLPHVTVAAGSTVPPSTTPVASIPPVASTAVVASSVPPVQPTTLPAGFVQLTDDTGSISIAAPTTWTDVITSPDTSQPPPVPQIMAAPDSDVFMQTFDQPGLAYWAYPYRTELTSLIDDFNAGVGCAARATGPYDDGDFVGTYLFYSQCGDSGQGEFHVVIANPYNQAFTAIVEVQIPTPNDRAIVGTVLSTFEMTNAVSTTGTVPEITTAPGTAPSPPTVAAGASTTLVPGPASATTSIG